MPEKYYKAIDARKIPLSKQICAKFVEPVLGAKHLFLRQKSRNFTSFEHQTQLFVPS